MTIHLCDKQLIRIFGNFMLLLLKLDLYIMRDVISLLKPLKRVGIMYIGI